MPQALTARFGIIYHADTDLTLNDVNNRIYNLCEKYHLQALTSPIHKPDDDEKKEHIHIIWLGSVSPSKWSLWRRECKQILPFMAVFPEVKYPSELKAYTLYMTHDTEASKGKQQFTKEDKAVREWLAF